MAEKKVEVKLLRHCVVDGKPREAGTTVKVDKSDAQMLVGTRKASYDKDAKPTVKPTPKTKAGGEAA